MTKDLPSTDEFRVSCDIEVRWPDMDALGHVNNAVFFTYFEIGRVAYMNKLGHCNPETASMQDLFPFVIAELNCRLLNPIVLKDKLQLYIRTSEIGTKSFKFEYLMIRKSDQQPVALGSSIQVYYDYATQTTSIIPDNFRELIMEREKMSLI
jgi:acyl-CoA thioester hydrolase